MKNTKKRLAILDCFSGISGDMTVGAFLDMGMDFTYLERTLRSLKLKGYSLARKKVKRGDIQGTTFSVRVKTKKQRALHGMTLKDIMNLLTKSALPPRVIERSCHVFKTLTRAEAIVHGRRPEAVHFHDVGAIDSIVDVVATAVCLEWFTITDVFVQNINLGSGSLSTIGHGTQPVPAPATIELLKGYPVTMTDIPAELVTPTGAAFIASFTVPNKVLPAFTLEKVGYGVGSTILQARPNVLRLMLGERHSVWQEDTLTMLETNIDDMPPLVYEQLFTTLFERGARDVFITPIVMKKNRPAHKLSVLFDAAFEKQIIRIVFTETSTFGVRLQTVRRAVLPRKIVSVKTMFGPVAVKVSDTEGALVHAIPEYEACKKLARSKCIPFMTVYTEAAQAAQDFVRKHP